MLVLQPCFLAFLVVTEMCPQHKVSKTEVLKAGVEFLARFIILFFDQIVDSLTLFYSGKVLLQLFVFRQYFNFEDLFYYIYSVFVFLKVRNCKKSIPLISVPNYDSTGIETFHTIPNL